MSFQAVIVIIIVTAVISYLIGLFDAKTTHKWFGAENKKYTPSKSEPEIVVKIHRLAEIQVNEQNEILVSYEPELENPGCEINSLNKSKLIELVAALQTLSETLVSKPMEAYKTDKKVIEKLAIQQPLLKSALKQKSSKKPAVLGLVDLLNEQLDLMKDQSPYFLDIRENPDHSLVFLVNERPFSTLDEIVPAEAQEFFQKAIDNVSGKT